MGLWEASRDSFELDELFALFDHDGNGTIDFHELHRM